MSGNPISVATDFELLRSSFYSTDGHLSDGSNIDLTIDFANIEAGAVSLAGDVAGVEEASALGGYASIAAGALALANDSVSAINDYKDHNNAQLAADYTSMASDAMAIAASAAFLGPEFLLAGAVFAAASMYLNARAHALAAEAKRNHEAVNSGGDDTGGTPGPWDLVPTGDKKKPAVTKLPTLVDPLVVDLVGLGINLTGVDGSSTYFDYSGSGVKVETGWIGTGQGILVFAPVNGSDIGAGDVLGAQSGSGFSDLAGYDSNGDGKIDENDAVFSNLRVWIDANSDGSSSAGELYSLKQLGISSINLSVINSYQNVNGNSVVGSVSYTKDNGDVSSIYEVNFQTDPQISVLPSSTTTLSSDALKLPELDGFGLLPDLRVRLETQGWAFRRRRLLPMATRIMACDTSMRFS